MKTSVLFAFAILLPVLAYHPPRPSGGEASPDDEMYEVYSAAIRDIFLEWHDGTKSPDELAARLVVVRDHALAYRWDKTEEPAERTLKWAKSAVAVDKSTVEDFKRKCADSISLEARFTLPAKLVLISDHELENSFKNGRSWPSFYERYPNSIGYIVLSQVGFNTEHDQAFLYIGNSCGSLCGAGYYVLLAKDQGTWSVKHKDMLFAF